MALIEFPYRWMWRTAAKNLRSAWYQVWYGLGNLISWAPVVWRDRGWDFDYILAILEFKLRRVAEHTESYGCHVKSDHDAARQRLCVALIRRIREDDYQPARPYFEGNRSWFRAPQRDMAYLGQLLGKHGLGWWE